MQFSLFNYVDGKVLNQSCTACELANNLTLKTNCMKGVGPSSASLYFIGKSPGKEDDGIGEPMTGANGRLFRELLSEAGINPDSVFIDNCIKCCSYDTPLKDKHWKACKGHLIANLSRVKPKAIVAVGSEALTWLTGESGVRKLRRHGLPCTIDDNLLVFPIGQPAQLFHAEGAQKNRLRTEMVEDLIWLRKRMEEGSLTRQDELPVDYQTARTVEDVKRFLEECDAAEWVYCDLETGKKDFSKGQLFPNDEGWIIALGMSIREGHARIIPIHALGLMQLYYWTEKELAEIMPLLRAFFLKKKTVWHNGVQFDQKWLKYELGLDRINIVFDSFYAHYLIDPDHNEYHRLEAIAKVYTNMPPWKKTFQVRDLDRLAYYLGRDVDATCRITPKLMEEMTLKQHWLLENLLIPLGHELKEMEYRGVKIDRAALSALSLQLEKDITKAKQEISSMDEVRAFEFQHNTTFSPSSPDDLRIVMQDFLKLPVIEKTGKGEYSTNARVLEAYSHEPFIQKVQFCRRASKLKSTYCDGILEKLDKTDSLHTSYQPTTVGGRLRSEDPNLQNIPREGTSAKVLADPKAMKRIFIARDGYVLLQQDYSQIELRVLAMYSRDPGLVEIYQQGLDVHTATAAKVFGISMDQVTKEQRNLAKPVNFGIIYGKSLESIIEDFIIAFKQTRKDGKGFVEWSDGQLVDKAQRDGREFWDGHQRAFPWVWRYMSEQEQIIRSQQYQETFLGRRRYYEYITPSEIRQAYNTPIQSVAADFTFFALIRCMKAFRELGIDCHPVLTVYDSIVWEVKLEQFWQVVDAAKMISEGITFDFVNVPLVIDLAAGFNWADLRKVDAKNHLIKEAE